MTPRQQALHVARQRIRFPSTDARIHQVVHTLAVALGGIRTEAGSIKALHAVLVWLERPLGRAKWKRTPPRDPH